MEIQRNYLTSPSVQNLVIKMFIRMSVAESVIQRPCKACLERQSTISDNAIRMRLIIIIRKMCRIPAPQHSICTTYIHILLGTYVEIFYIVLIYIPSVTYLGVLKTIWIVAFMWILSYIDFFINQIYLPRHKIIYYFYFH